MFEVICDWAALKDFAQSRGLSIQYVDFNGNYYLSVIDRETRFSVGMIMSQEDPNNSDLQDFESNFKDLGNSSFVTSSYATYIDVRQTASTSAGATVFSFRNPAASGKNIFIEKINLIMFFDSSSPLFGTPLKYKIQSFDSATPSGGTTQSPAKLDSSSPDSLGPDIRSLHSGLTTTSVNFGGVYSVLGCPAATGSVSVFSKRIDDYVVKLTPGDGLCIRLAVDAVSGQSLCGEIIWSERA